MNCCVIWTASGQQTTRLDSIVITDDEYRMFRVAQETLKECLTIQDLKDTQYKNATLNRNVEHLQIMMAQEWFSEALTLEQTTDINSAIAG